VTAAVAVLPSAIERAGKLAVAMTADPEVADDGDRTWTVQDVINVALSRGLGDLEQRYLAGHS
jgi:glucosamine 6-phosphate synthetase-like amidotransferase/phosphosugar isomerase protein